MTRPATALTLCGLFVLSTGCSKQPAAAPAGGAPTASAGDHAHGSGPHGGAVADWGGGAYHVEFTVNHDEKKATVYVFGSDAKTPAPIAATQLVLSIEEPAFEVELNADPQAGETDGVASRFVGSHDSLGVVQEFAGSITGVVEGTPYAGDFAEGAHEHSH